MKKSFCCFCVMTMLVSSLLWTGCSTQAQNSYLGTAETTMEGSTEHSDINETQIQFPLSPETGREVAFRYIYRGFTAVPLNDHEVLERFVDFNQQIIITEEEWSAFMDSYCPGIPYNEPWDFSKDYLIAYITQAASPAYTKADCITSLVLENGGFTPKYEDDPPNYVYALNSEEYTHFYVEVIAVSKEQQDSVPVGTEPKPNKVDFKTVFRGFEIVSLDDSEMFERYSEFGTKVIATEVDWSRFRGTFCPAIPACETVDFTKHSLIVSVMMGAKPTYAVARKIVGIDTKYGCPVFEDPATNCVYALNTENDTHFYIAVIALPREQIADHLEVWAN